MNDPLFEVHGLSKRFGGIVALAGAGFHIRSGEVLGLIGPNGAGKSTLFECLAGVLPPDSGSILIHGRPAGVRERASILFYVPDGIAPWPAKRWRWALEFAAGFFRGRSADRDEIVDQLGLAGFLAQPIGTLSK